MKDPNTPTDLMLRQVERRNRAIARMTQDIAWLIDRPQGSVKWLATQTDLVEMLHIVWQQHTLIGPDGLPYTRTQLARKAFAAIGRRVPRSMAHIVWTVHNRMDPRRSMRYRYEYWDGDHRPIARLTDTTPQP